MKRYGRYHIHGDNIVECERTFGVVRAALGDRIGSIAGPQGMPVCPEYVLKMKGEDRPLVFAFFPGYGRWNADILELVRGRGGVLREAADVIVAGVEDGKEEPLIAVEYCSALPAGNQAWQRNGRAYSFGKAKIPYLYVAELGGYELDADRGRKAARMPNPAVPFSYLAYSLEQGLAILPVFVTSPGADEESRAAHASYFADTELVAITRAILLGNDPREVQEALRRKVLAMVRSRAGASRVGRTLSATQWEQAYTAVERGESLTAFLVAHARIRWRKTAYITDLTPTAKALMELASPMAIGLTAADLPMCVIERSERAAFAKKVATLYPDLQQDFVDWLGRDDHLVICWVMGFKPRGDDARPDRGLAPLARMLVGGEQDVMSVVYGPAPKGTWQMLRDKPDDLTERSGLWQAILKVSDALLVDAATDGVERHGYLKEHWASKAVIAPHGTMFTQGPPTRIGENDVDTVLHTLLDRLGGEGVYEGMCNPPGGDWSGVSLQVPDRSCELRWLSLPRVSGNTTKRPDHVFQFFGLGDKAVVLAVESKEEAGAVESHIGQRLCRYITNLVETPPSVERKAGRNLWGHSSQRLDSNAITLASAVAFISGSMAENERAIARAGVDLAMVFEFTGKGQQCTIKLFCKSGIGRAVAGYIRSLRSEECGVIVTTS
ncbi:MAG TPA: hypothetical protein VLH60_05505 [Sedimentisphaerales bacterium]|nr:hypothetical protein [Sedimentisphaerales bacterium]